MLFQPICLACVMTMSLALTYLSWVGMLCWETSQYLPCVVVTLGYIPAFHRSAPLVEGFLIIGIASSLVWLSYMCLLVWGTVRVYIPLRDCSRHAYIAPNTGMPCNTHTIMRAAEQYMFCAPGFSLFGETMLGLVDKKMNLYTIYH